MPFISFKTFISTIYDCPTAERHFAEVSIRQRVYSLLSGLADKRILPSLNEVSVGRQDDAEEIPQRPACISGTLLRLHLDFDLIRRELIRSTNALSAARVYNAVLCRLDPAAVPFTSLHVSPSFSGSEHASTRSCQQYASQAKSRSILGIVPIDSPAFID